METRPINMTLRIAGIALALMAALTLAGACDGGAGILNPNNFPGTGGGGGGGGSSSNTNTAVNDNTDDQTNDNTGNNDTTNDNAGDDGTTNDNAGGDNTASLAVTLTVSNQTPGLFEDVLLSCRLTNGGSSQGVLFNFFPMAGTPDGLLDDNPAGGTAIFTVNEEDLGRIFMYACRATDDLDSGPDSNTVIISPTVVLP